MLPASVRSPRRPYLETVPPETAVRVSICLPPALLFARVFERVRGWVGPAAAARGRRRPGASDRGRAADQHACLLYTSDAADDLLCVDLGGRRIIKKKKNK